MRTRLGLCLLVTTLTALVSVVSAVPSRAKEGAGREAAASDTTPTTFLPLAAVKPGMRGYGFTVKHGARLERFEVEVIDVIDNWLAKQDVILVRCLGEAFADHQIAQGMSGSPIYVDGRLMGALSYAFPWSKHAIAGVTPIHAMLAEGARILEKRPTGALPPTPLRSEEAAAPQGAGAAKTTTGGLQPIGTPLALGGFSRRGQARLRDALGQRGLSVVVAGGARGAGAPGGAGQGAQIDAPVVPGAAITVDLLRGDFSASALGTITHVDDTHAYGFGHDFAGLGETLLPASVGYVYTVVASRNISFKLGGPLREIGAMVQDRPSGIVCTLGAKAPMVPVRATFRNAVTQREEAFQFEVTPNTIYFQTLLMSALQEAFSKAEATLGPNTKRMKMTVKLKGMEPWSYEDVVAGFDGGFRRTLMHLVDRPLTHWNQRPEFERFDLEVEVEHTDRRAHIRSVVAMRDEARPGDVVDLLVHLETQEPGPPVFERLPVTIPEGAPEGTYAITVVGGDLVPADMAAPKDLADYPRVYEAFLKSTELVALLPLAQVDVDVAGHRLRGLPLSALARLARSADAPTLGLRQASARVRKTVPYVIAGREKVTLRIAR